MNLSTPYMNVDELDEKQRIDDAWERMVEQLNRIPRPSQLRPMAQPQNIPQQTSQNAPQCRPQLHIQIPQGVRHHILPNVFQDTEGSEAQRQQDLEDWRAIAGGEEYLARIKTHLDRGNSLACPLCGEKCTSAEQLQNHHSDAHPTSQRFLCPHFGCGKAFERDFQRENHVKYDYSDGHDMTHFKCTECQRNFASVTDLNYHQTPSICPHCRKEFRCERVLSGRNHNCGFMA
jgi:hypothetical protein